MSRRYEEQVEVRLGRADEHGVRVEGVLPMVGGREELNTLGALDALGARGPQGGLDTLDDLDLGQLDLDGVEVPTVFLWRGRVHLVRAVLARWSQRVPWWRPEESAGGVLERQVWRVEAGAGRAMGIGVYDLVQDDRWWLARVND